MNEADTCRRYVVPKLQDAGWDDEPHRIIVSGHPGRRRPGKRADMPIAVVEAKGSYATPGQGIQEAKDHAEILGLEFAYPTNRHGIVEFDYIAGQERGIDPFPMPGELWARLKGEL